jgi:iron complex transport system substrate-binding protein
MIFIFLSCQDRHGGGNPVQQDTSAGGSAAPSSTERTTIRYAHGFSIDYFDHYKRVRILNHQGNTIDTLEYLLVQDGYPRPAGYPGAQVIRVPVKTMIASSSMHIALAGFCGVEDRIIGLANLQYVSSPSLRTRIKAGQIREVGLEGSMNDELIISMHPDIMMAMENPEAGFGKYKLLTEAGIPVLLNAEWLENTPLGRAEWVKLMAALVNREDLVNKKFDSIAVAYLQLARIGRNAPVKPTVIVGMPFKGTWYMPAGQSYAAQFLRDAGATYKWSDTRGTGALPLNFESVAPEALKAVFWLNIGDVQTKNEMAARDERFTAFLPFRTGKMYDSDKRINDTGNNDYWESGAVRPDVILADLISILHPDLLPGHELVYYKQIQ